MDKIRNRFEVFNEQIDKENRKVLETFHKKVGISGDLTLEEINEQVLEYVSSMKENFYEVALLDEQKSDAEFMLNLYQSNPEMTIYQKPKDEELKKNVDFMLEYIQLNYQRNIEEAEKNGLGSTIFGLSYIVSDYKELLDNPEFIEKFAKVYPNENIFEFIREVIRNYPLPYYTIDEKFEKIKVSLSEELLCSQARKFGSNILHYVPQYLPFFSEVVSAGIECDGFKSLGYLDITKVLANKDLILKAYKKDGVEALENYITKTLSPDRTKNILIDNEVQEYSFFDGRYDFVQKSLKEDSVIRTIFDREKKLKAYTNNAEVIKPANRTASMIQKIIEDNKKFKEESNQDDSNPSLGE